MADPIEAAAKDVHLVNSVIVDAFVQAVEKYSDGNTSWRQDFRHGLEKVAPLIIARHDAARLKDAPLIASIQSRHNATLAYVASGELSYETAFLIAHADRAQLCDHATAQAARIEALEKTILAAERANDHPGCFDMHVYAVLAPIVAEIRARATLEVK